MKITHSIKRNLPQVGDTLPLRLCPIGTMFRYGPGGILRIKISHTKNHWVQKSGKPIDGEFTNADLLVIVSNMFGD